MRTPHDRNLVFREATAADLESIVRLLADDTLGQQRERFNLPLEESYQHAFAAIERDPNNEVLVACMEGAVVATLQVTYTPSLSYQGSWRATIESVRTSSSLRGQGIGSAFMQWAVERAQRRGCRIIQLSTNKERAAARRFYERLGFRASHEGMKLDTQRVPE